MIGDGPEADAVNFRNVNEVAALPHARVLLHRLGEGLAFGARVLKEFLENA